MTKLFPLTLVAALMGAAAPTLAADPWADFVIDYNSGTNADVGYAISSSALGKPTLIADVGGMYPGVVTPFSPAFLPQEVVSIGAGGFLTLKFDEPVVNDPLNPYGIDLLVFGNAFYSGTFFESTPPFDYLPNALTTGIASDGGQVEVSSDGVTFTPVIGIADGAYPTNAYADIATAFTPMPSAIEADFTRPVNPAFDGTGKTFAQIIAGYEGSGGGLGIDLGLVGLSSISYVRISTPPGAVACEIDAVADVRAVPEPAASTLVLSIALIFLGKSVRSSNVKEVT